jgi:hypothetical protein
MMLHNGPVAILSAAGGGHQAIRVGEMIGPYKLAEIGDGTLTFEWNGQTYVKNTEDLIGQAKEAAPPAPAPAESRTAAPAPPPEPVKAGPGAETPYGIRTCSMNDGTAEGTVMDGYVKRVYTSPFGKTCGWERVK